MSDSGVEQETSLEATVEVVKKKGKTRKGRPRKAVIQATSRNTPPTQQFTPQKPVLQPSQTAPQAPQTLVQPLQTLFHPLQTVLQPQQTLFQTPQSVTHPPRPALHPSQTVLQPQQPAQILLQPPQTVLQPQQAVAHPPQTILQHPPATPQPPKPGTTENNPPPGSLVQFTAFPNTFSSPVLNSALQSPVQQAAPSSMSTTSQTSTMSLLNALHDEKLGLLLPVIVRMEHKMDQLMAQMGQMGSQLNAIVMANQSNAAMTGNHLNAAMTGNQSNAVMTGNQSNAVMAGNQSNTAMTGNQSNAALTGSQTNAAMSGNQSNATITETQNNTRLTLPTPVNIPVPSNTAVNQTPSNATQSNTTEMATQSSVSTQKTQSNTPNNQTSRITPPGMIETRSQRGRTQRDIAKMTEQVLSGDDNTIIPISRENIIALQTKSNSTKNFAVRLLRELFTKEELEGKNISGSRGKDQVDPERIMIIKEIVFKMYHTQPADREMEWRNCRKAMDSFLRSKKRKAEGREQQAFQNAELLENFSLGTFYSQESEK